MINKITKILACVDFSSYSRSTLEYAIELSAFTKAKLLIVNIVNQKDIDWVKKAINSKHPDTFSLTKHFSGEMERRKLKLQEMIKAIPGSAELPFEIFIGHGVPYVEILNAIDREKADFLIFGPKGRTNIKEFLFGSVAEKLFRHSPVPVMSLRGIPEIELPIFTGESSETTNQSDLWWETYF